MKAAKLILLSSPALIASLVVIAQPAEASIVKSIPNQLVSESITPNSSQQENPIKDKMGCNCSVCTQAKLELQGKLPLSKDL